MKRNSIGATFSCLQLTLLIIGCALFSLQGATWSRHYPSLTGDALVWAAHGPGGFLLQGAQGDLLLSSNGVDWTRSSFAFGGPVAYLGERIFLVGRGFVVVATNGLTGFYQFVQLPFIFALAENNAIACEGNACVIVGDRGQIYYSHDAGDTWQPTTFNNSQVSWQATAFGAGAFVSISGNTVIRSVNGSQWTLQTNINLGLGLFAANAIAFGGGRFVIAASDGNVAVSTNGMHWSVVNIPGAHHLNTVAWMGSHFLAASYLGTLYTSPDGISWTERPDSVPSVPLAIASSPETALVVGGGGTISVSTNGQPFTLVNGPHSQTIEAVYAQGQWLVAANNVALRSTNGIDWVPVPQLTNSGPLFSVFHGNGRWFLGASLNAYTSTNGVDWDLVPGASLPIRTAVYGNGVFVAGHGSGNNAVLSYSTNGLDWHDADKQQSPQNDVVYFNGRFIAIGAQVLLSTNGINWTEQPIPTNGVLSVITTTPEGFFAYGRGFSPAQGSFSFLARSRDGIQWSCEPVPAFLLLGSQIVTHLAWGRGTYAALINGGAPITSSDGRNWTQHFLDGRQSMRTLRFGGGAFVTAGRGETINRSEYVPPTFGPATIANGEVTVPLYTEAGVINHVEATTDFVTWNPLTTIVASNHVQRLTWSASEARGFFRAR